MRSPDLFAIVTFVIKRGGGHGVTTDGDTSTHHSTLVRIAHGGKRGVNETVKQRTKFHCQVCSVYFLTEYRLKSHRLSTGHKGVKGRPSK